MSPIEQELAALATLSLAQLREEWGRAVGGIAPPVSAALLRLAIGHALQERALGSLPRQVEQKLSRRAVAKTRSLPAPPGSRLVREWNGIVHVVTIGEDGSIEWNCRRWGSLSEVARAITGSRWSGPAFFGLRQKVQAA